MNQCGWPGHCPQYVYSDDGPLCTYHAKLAAGLIDGRVTIHGLSIKTTLYAMLSENLAEVGASLEIVEEAGQKPRKDFNSIHSGGGMPQGRLHTYGAGG